VRGTGVKRSLGLLLAVAGAVVAFDYWTKRWATHRLAGWPPMPVFGDFVRFNYARNSGVAFGIGAGLPFPYYLFSIAAALVILYLFVKQRVTGVGRSMALALILGGAIGNLLDRIKAGSVVDFIEIGWDRWRWPLFNVADSAVSIGVLLFAITWSRHDPAPLAQDAAGASGSESAHAPSSSPGSQEHESSAGSLGSVASHGGAAGPLPGRGADGPLA
jgi:signal peptidase II